MAQPQVHATATVTAKADLSHALAEIIGDLAQVVSEGALALAERTREFAHDPERREQLQVGITAVTELIETELRRYEQDFRSYLYDEMLAGTAVLLIAKVRIDDESVLLDGLEFAFSKSDLVHEAQAAVAASSILSEDQRQRILHGLEQLSHRSWIHACDSLLTGAEGMIWDAAIDRGAIDARRQLTDPSKRHRKIKSVNGLLDDRTIDGLRPSYRHFLDRQLFGAAGNDLRHGRSGRDPRAGALFAAAAVLGWLDHSDETELVPQLGSNLDRFVEQLADEVEAEQRASEALVSPSLSG